MAKKRVGRPVGQDKLEKRQKAAEKAWAAACKKVDEVIRALRNADLVTTKSARKLFNRQAKRAMKSAENWRVAAENLLKTPSV